MREGLQPGGATRVVRLRLEEAPARQLGHRLGELLDPESHAVAAFEAADGRSWLVEIFDDGRLDPASLLNMVALALPGPIGKAAIRGAEIAALERRDWVAAALAGLPPVHAGRFLIHGSHDRAARASHRVSLEIEAALAFGTGHHGTTRGCLLLLDRLLIRRRPRHILDIGTGTGVLALAAARVLHAPIMATDNDREAVATARTNARLNGAGPWLRPLLADGLRHPAIMRAPRPDLVMANILARPLRRLAPSLARRLAPGGDVILSGLLPTDERRILDAYAAQGLRLVERRPLDGWLSLRLRRGGAAARPRRGVTPR